MLQIVYQHLPLRTNVIPAICIDVNYELSQKYHGHRDAIQYLDSRAVQSPSLNRQLYIHPSLELQSRIAKIILLILSFTKCQCLNFQLTFSVFSIASSARSACIISRCFTISFSRNKVPCTSGATCPKSDNPNEFSSPNNQR